MIFRHAVLSMALFVLLATDSSNAFMVTPPTTMPTRQAPTTTSLNVASSPEHFSIFGVTKHLFPGEVEKRGDLEVIKPDFKAAGMALSAAGLVTIFPVIQAILAPILTWLGLVFFVQTFRVRVVFDDDSIQLRKGGSALTKGKSNFIVGGGITKMKYEDVVNYDFWPKGWIDEPQGPLIAYIKETTTDKSKWNWGPGAWANSPKAIENGAIPGQVHFMPALFDCKELRDQMEKHGCQKL